MAQLDCGVENCVYNKCKSCCKGDITVGGKHAESRGDTCCESFSGRRAENSYISALEHPCHTISIDCEACDCMYNKNYKCHAEHVDISGKGACECGQTSCNTFRKQS